MDYETDILLIWQLQKTLPKQWTNIWFGKGNGQTGIHKNVAEENLNRLLICQMDLIITFIYPNPA